MIFTAAKPKALSSLFAEAREALGCGDAALNDASEEEKTNKYMRGPAYPTLTRRARISLQ